MTAHQSALVRRYERYLCQDTAPPVDLTAALLNQGLDPSGIEASLDCNSSNNTEAQ